jgi:transposase InsO family protein
MAVTGKGGRDTCTLDYAKFRLMPPDMTPSGHVRRRSDGRPIRILAILDDCTPECPYLTVDHSLPSVRVIEALDDLAMERPPPARLVCDHGADFASRAFLSWARLRGIALDFIGPGQPTDNVYIESFNGKFRDECLNEQYFLTLDDTLMLVEPWCQHYNRVRPHSALHHLPPSCIRQTVLQPTKPRIARTQTGVRLQHRGGGHRQQEQAAATCDRHT